MSDERPDLGMRIARRIGLRLDPVLRTRLGRLIDAGARDAGVSRHAFATHLERDAVAMQGILDDITIQESSFFRDPAQFEVLRRQIIPALVPPILVWSAACANGQEPYSIAMCLADTAPGEWRVVATDVSTTAVARARAARYSDREIAAISEEDRARFLHRVPGGWEVAAELRARVEVVHSNLITGPPPLPPGSCQVIMCRNVLIYFERDALLTVLDRLAEALTPDGHLFLGYSESLWQVSDRFRLTSVGRAFAYRLPEAGSERAPLPRPTRSRSGAAGGQPRRGAEAPAPEAAAASRAAGSRAGLPGAIGAGRPGATGASRPGGTGAGRAAGSARTVHGADAPALPAPRAKPAEVPDVIALLARGEIAMAQGDPGAAATAFRQAVYLDPDNVIAHVQLGFAFEATGDAAAALRSFTAARAALGRADTAVVEAELEGYGHQELVRLLDARTGGRR